MLISFYMHGFVNFAWHINQNYHNCGSDVALESERVENARIALARDEIFCSKGAITSVTSLLPMQLWSALDK